MSEILLSARGISKSFGALKANDDVSLDIAAGSVHALIGPNGAGKSTAVGLLAGEQSADSGTVTYDGRDITDIPPHARARLGLKRSYQITSLFAEFTVLENGMMAVLACEPHAFRMFGNANADTELRRRTIETLKTLRIDDIADQPVAALAHGVRRQLELAMVLAGDPKMLLLDEPMAGMGRAESAALTKTISALKQDTTILLVEHDMDVVFSLADTITVLDKGRVIATGTPDDIRKIPSSRPLI